MAAKMLNLFAFLGLVLIARAVPIADSDASDPTTYKDFEIIHILNDVSNVLISHKNADHHVVVNYLHVSNLGEGMETTSYRIGDHTIERKRLVDNVECTYKEGVHIFDDADDKLKELIVNTQSLRQAVIDNGVQSLTWASENNDRVSQLELDDNKRIKSFLRIDKFIVDGQEKESTRSYRILNPAHDSEFTVPIECMNAMMQLTSKIFS